MNILGHENQIKLIRRFIQKKCFPNSLILSGQKGIGKSLIAKNTALNLIEAIKSEDFRIISEIKNLNILYISRIYLEDKKRFKQSIYRDDISHINNFFSTKNGINSKRVCIIDSIDELSIDAVNSLLKTIEEPNKNNHFILISHDNKKLIPTIRSRSFEIKFQNFNKENFLSILKNIDDINSCNHNYMYDLTRGSIHISRNFIDYNFNDLDEHLLAIYQNKEKIKSNTAYHYINFLNDKGADKDLIISFFNFLLLKAIFFIKNEIKNVHNTKVDHFLMIIDEISKFKERYTTFNLSYEHILIHFFNLLKKQ